MNSREVTIWNGQTNRRVKVRTSAANWGQLKELITNGVTTMDGNNFVVDMTNLQAASKYGEDKMILGYDNNALPTGDFYLFLSAAKVKSGQLTEEQTQRIKEAIHDMLSEVIDVLNDAIDEIDSSTDDKDLDQMAQEMFNDN